MYFYRKPRVDKILFQAEVLENKLSSKNIVEKNEGNFILKTNQNICKTIFIENSVPNENSSDDYFENNTDFGEMIKVRTFSLKNYFIFFYFLKKRKKISMKKMKKKMFNFSLPKRIVKRINYAYH